MKIEHKVAGECYDAHILCLCLQGRGRTGPYQDPHKDSSNRLEEEFSIIATAVLTRSSSFLLDLCKLFEEQLPYISAPPAPHQKCSCTMTSLRMHMAMYVISFIEFGQEQVSTDLTNAQLWTIFEGIT